MNSLLFLWHTLNWHICNPLKELLSPHDAAEGRLENESRATAGWSSGLPRLVHFTASSWHSLKRKRADTPGKYSLVVLWEYLNCGWPEVLVYGCTVNPQWSVLCVQLNNSVVYMQVMGFLSVKRRVVLPVVHLPSYSHSCLTPESAVQPFLHTVVKKLLTADRLGVTPLYLTVAGIFRCVFFLHGPSFDLRAFEGDLIRHCSRWSRPE